MSTMQGGSLPLFPRKPQRLLFSLLGELIESGMEGPVPAGVYLDILNDVDVARPTGRAALDRLVVTGYLARDRVGRSVVYGLTPYGREVMDEARIRVHSPYPFAPEGDGWTMVTFTLPESLRALRQQVRTALTWEGFAPLRDGLWVAPGNVDLSIVLDPYRDEMPPHAVAAFRAQEIPGFSASSALSNAWDLDSLRDLHLKFLSTWEAPEPIANDRDALGALVALGADWTTLIAADPRLPDSYLGTEWPGPKSAALYTKRRKELIDQAHATLRQLAGF